MILRPSDRHNGIPYTDKITSLYWIRARVELSTRGPILSKHKKDYGPTPKVQHGVELTGKPCEQWPKGQPLALQPVEEHEIQNMLDQNIIAPSNSPIASPVVLVKKFDGSYCFCVD